MQWNAKGLSERKHQSQTNKKRLSPKIRGKPDVISKIRALWLTMAKEGIIRDGSETALDAYVHKMTKLQNGKEIAVLSYKLKQRKNTYLYTLYI
ncbi:phage protein GemA/Gp16 family protein [Enterovibrio norvegicus]|uniref:phage protein GemA/Gp16 family protein n=1 Tax=Enterovibrio norvegicus TaxID=188144 RepID=UPI003D103EC0